MEYAIEAVALFNPSIVPALHQEGVPAGSVRFVMSLRATGEGHISSIVFRSGVIDANGDVRLDAPRAYSKTLKAALPDQFSKSTFRRDLATLGVVDGHFNRSWTGSAITSRAISSQRRSTWCVTITKHPVSWKRRPIP